jgi:D-alanyl-D-alanine dipeptidase
VEKANRVNASPAPCLPVACILLFLANAGAAQPQENPRDFRPDDLVEIIALDSTIRLDIRYATSNNFMGRPMYSQARAFLQRPAAEALVRVHRGLVGVGFGLLVLDGYRPWSVTRKFWDEIPPEKRKFVANPEKGSRHNRGCAVDVTLFDLETGKEISMPSAYDDFSHRAHVSYRGGTAEQRRMRNLLIQSMESEGYRVLSGEWWHFDFRDWRQYRILNIPFEELSVDPSEGTHTSEK